MNTLFRVLYTVVIQWRTYMMVCGPEGGGGCFSLMNREMVRKLRLQMYLSSNVIL